MKVSEVITKLQTFNPDADVVVMSTHDNGDDVTDWNICDVIDWNVADFHLGNGYQVSIEINLDQRPDYLEIAGAAALSKD